MLEVSVLLSRELAWGLDMLPLAPIHRYYVGLGTRIKTLGIVLPGQSWGQGRPHVSVEQRR